MFLPSLSIHGSFVFSIGFSLVFHCWYVSYISSHWPLFYPWLHSWLILTNSIQKTLSHVSKSPTPSMSPSGPCSQTSYMRNTWELSLPPHMWTPSYKDCSWLRKRKRMQLVCAHVSDWSCSSQSQWNLVSSYDHELSHRAAILHT